MERKSMINQRGWVWKEIEDFCFCPTFVVVINNNDKGHAIQLWIVYTIFDALTNVIRSFASMCLIIIIISIRFDIKLIK